MAFSFLDLFALAAGGDNLNHPHRRYFAQVIADARPHPGRAVEPQAGIAAIHHVKNVFGRNPAGKASNLLHGNSG